MPYIKQVDRGCFANLLAELDHITIDSPGELNYLVSMLAKKYLSAMSAGEKRGYQAINDVVGVLEAAKLEFYRRVAVPYEDRKITENGDVY
jgi:hypothetical protein